MIQRYDMISVTRCGEAWQELQRESEGDWMRYEDHLQELERLRGLLRDAEHLCKWLLQSDISDIDRERVIRENGIAYALAIAELELHKEG